MDVMTTILAFRKWTRTDWAWFGAGALSLFLSLSFVVPWRPYLVRSGELDDSWMLALNALFGGDLQFGRDLLFTYGPWGFLDTRCYYPQTYAVMVLVWAFVALVLWRACWLISRQYISRPGVAFIWLVATLGCAALEVRLLNATLMFLIATLVVYYFYVDSRTLSATSVLLVGAVALASLVKFSYLLTAAVAVLPITADQLRRKQVPSVLLMFCTFFGVLFLLAKQRVSSLWPYLTTSMHMAAHYTDAMSLSPRVPPVDLASWIITASLLIAVVLVKEWRQHKWSAVVSVSALSGILFMTYKWGYVRHDRTHAAPATLALLAMVCLYVPSLRALLPGRRWGWKLAGVVVAAMMVCWATVSFSAHRALPVHFARSLFARIPANLGAAVRLGLGTSSLPVEYAEALAEIRRASPLPALHGPVRCLPVGPIPCRGLWTQLSAAPRLPELLRLFGEPGTNQRRPPPGPPSR